MSETKRGKDPVLVRWIGDVQSVNKHGILALLYPDQASFENRHDVATLEVPREQISDDLWGKIRECSVLQCSLEIDRPTNAYDEPMVTNVRGIDFDPEFSALLNRAVLMR